MAAIRQDYTKADLNEQDRAMLDFVKGLTLEPARQVKTDVARLREVGFDDRAILQIAGIAAWFNYVNRMADALGVGRDLAP